MTPSRLKSAGDGRRHAGWKIDPSRARGLRPDHPAVVEGRTLFPTTVVEPMNSPRMLIEGKNSPKTGWRVEVGPWAGLPIFTLTLEERRTCPPSCAVWSDCYGNAMHLARRHDARHPDFMTALAAEMITRAREYPDGFVVRVHILGDFFSPRYVLAWAHLLDMLPNLYVWGYTARRPDLDDENSRRTARALEILRRGRWSRFAIRTSHTEPGPDRTIVVDEDPGLPDVVVCPQETGKTASCATCGLCWAPASRRKTIAFLRHGRKVRGSPKPIQSRGEPEPGSPEWWEMRDA